MSRVSKFIDKPLEKFVTVHKDSSMKKARTTYQCPLCQIPFPKREFEEHIYKIHSTRAEEAFAKLFGLSYPVRCSCGKELHYSTLHKGFPKTCGNCQTDVSDSFKYQSAEDAHKHIEQLQALNRKCKARRKTIKARG